MSFRIKPIYALEICAVVAILAGCAGQSQFEPSGVMQAPPFSQTGRDAAVKDSENTQMPQSLVLPLVGVSPEQLDAERAGGRTIPFFKDRVKSPLDGKWYRYRIVGEDPTKSLGTTYIPYVPVILVITYPDGTVLDPAQPACSDSVSVERRFLKGPNFVPTDLISNGVNVGKVQLGDAFQRAEFWKVLRSSKYHTVLQAAKNPIVVQVKAPSTSYTRPGICSGGGHRIGYFPLDAFIKLTHRLSDKYATPTQVPILLAYNTVVFRYAIQAEGFHGAFKRSSGIQTVIYASYVDQVDIMYLTHEIGELLNDPYDPIVVDKHANHTPAWGHVGQYRGSCSHILEVGDPLTNTTFDVKEGGFTYHPQDLAFFSWFFRKTSIGTGGKYSFIGTFTGTQGICT